LDGREITRVIKGRNRQEKHAPALKEEKKNRTSAVAIRSIVQVTLKKEKRMGRKRPVKQASRFRGGRGSKGGEYRIIYEAIKRAIQEPTREEERRQGALTDQIKDGGESTIVLD